MYRWLLASERDRLVAKSSRREIVSPLVADGGQQTFFSLIRWDLVFLFVQSTHHFTVHGHKQTGGILLGERKQQNVLRLRRKQEGLRPD